MVNVTNDGVLFAKNSDRDANEAQVLEWVPARSHGLGAKARCTYITIDQVERTNSVLLSRPWWMYGAEMGANEFGVVIGNEAVFTRQADGPTSLLGMDLLRLGLERASSASDAANVIVSLLEQYGQGGACSYERPNFTYHNSFLIADRRGAIVLETAGSKWASEEVKSGARSISNGLTIEGFASRYSRPLKSRVVGCAVRRARTEDAASKAYGTLDLMQALRDHGSDKGPQWSRLHGSLEAPCVHAGGNVASSQTTASLIADLRGSPLYWATGTSAPCTSIFKPLRFDEPMSWVATPTNKFDGESIWWRHERLHRAAVRQYRTGVGSYEAERDLVERSWIDSPPTTAAAFFIAQELEQRWLEYLPRDIPDQRPLFVQRKWRKLDEAASFPVDALQTLP